MVKRLTECLQHIGQPNPNGSSEDHVMADKALPSPEALRQLLKYDPETGCLTWRDRTADMFNGPDKAATCLMWNKKFSGKPALNYLSARGYLVGSVKPFTLTAHRVAIAIMNGSWPEGQVDHINGDRTDNRFVNLRVVDNLANCRNQARKRSNKTGVTGVFWAKHVKKWTAQIGISGKRFHLGLFDDFDDAVTARKNAEKANGFHPNHGAR